MGKLVSERERRLQRLLIPVNIFVCVLCLAAMISLIFLPILKIDVGKILRSEEFIDFVDEKLEEEVGGNLEGTDQQGVDYKPVVFSLVTNVLGTAEGSLSISAFQASKVFFSAEDEKSDVVLDSLFFGENALVNKLIDSIVDGVTNIFETDEGKAVVEEVVVATITTSLVKEINNENFDEANVGKLVERFKELENVGTNGVTVDTVVDGIVEEIERIYGGDVSISDSDKEELQTEIRKIYDETKSALGEDESVSLENIICVAVSQNVDLADYDISSIIDDLLGSIGGESSVNYGEAVSYKVAEGEVAGGENTVCTTYTELLEQMGLDDNKKAEIREKLNTGLHSTVNNILSDISEYIGYYGWLFIGMLVLIFPWFVLFLFSFFHLLAKNKRFMMWYVKLFGFIPALIFVAIVATIPALNFLMKKGILELSDDVMSYINLGLTGVSSMTWICGLCYILLWIVSIFWAFPIKHKIRKERKLIKKGLKNGNDYSRNYADNYSYGNNYGSGGYDGGYNLGSDGYGYDSGGFNDSYDFGSYSGLDTGFDDDDDDLFGSYDSLGYDGYSSFDDDDDLY